MGLRSAEVTKLDSVPTLALGAQCNRSSHTPPMWISAQRHYRYENATVMRCGSVEEYICVIGRCADSELAART